MLLDKLDEALAALVTPAATGFQVLTGKSAEEKTVPCVICSSEMDGDADPPGLGNFYVRATVAVKQDSTGVKATAQTAAGAIMAAVMVDDLPEHLNAAVAGLTVFPGSVQFGSFESGQDETGLWVDILRLRCYACETDLA